MEATHTSTRCCLQNLLFVSATVTLRYITMNVNHGWNLAIFCSILESSKMQTTEWKKTFAIFPVATKYGKVLWFKFCYKRRVFPDWYGDYYMYAQSGPKVRKTIIAWYPTRVLRRQWQDRPYEERFCWVWLSPMQGTAIAPFTEYIESEFDILREE